MKQTAHNKDLSKEKITTAMQHNDDDWAGESALTLAGFAIGHESVSRRTETPVAPWCVHALVLTGIPHLTLIDVWGNDTHTHTNQVNTLELSLISTLPVLHSYLYSGHPGTQNPSDRP